MPVADRRDNIGLPLDWPASSGYRHNIVDGMLSMLGLTEFAGACPVGLIRWGWRSGWTLSILGQRPECAASR